MATYACKDRLQLLAEKDKMIGRFQELRQQNLKLDMSRGKPSSMQLDLV